MVDQVYHGSFPLGGSTTEVLERVQKEYFGLPYVPNTVSTFKSFTQNVTSIQCV